MRQMKDSLFQRVRYKNQQGFTLVELLAVMAVIVIIGSIMGGILISSLRGATKAEEIVNTRQNGDYVLSQMAKTIRFATFASMTTTASTTVSSCVVPSVGGGTPTPTPAPYTAITINMPEDEQITYSCTATNIASNSASLLDESAVTLSNCSFTCNQLNEKDPPTIGISFSLSQKNSNVNFFEKSASGTFQTSVTMRNTQP